MKKIVLIILTCLLSLSAICAQEKNLVASFSSEKYNFEDDPDTEWFGGFYIGFSALSFKFSTISHQDMVKVEELIPPGGLSVPVHPEDQYAEQAGVASFTYKELTELYAETRPFHTLGIVPKFGFHLFSKLDIECSYDFLNMDLTTQDFPESRGMDEWPDQRYKYYMHRYANEADAFTVIRFKNDFSFRTLYLNAIININESLDDKLGLIVGFQRSFISVDYQAQSGWDRYYHFEAYKTFPKVSKKLTTSQFSLGIIYNEIYSDDSTLGLSFLMGYSESGFVFVFNLCEATFDL